MFLKNTLCIFFGIIFNDRYQSYSNNNKKLNMLIYFSIYSSIFSY